jgi:type II secretion system protein H
MDEWEAMMTFRIGNRNDNAPSGAFTLIELVLVMALLAIVLAVAFPSLTHFFRGRNIEAEARRFLSLTHYGQSRAVSEGVPMVLWIDTRQRTFGLEAATGYVETDTKAVEFTLDKDVQVEISVPRVLVRSTQLDQSARATANTPMIRFSPDGFISETSPDFIVFRDERDKGDAGIALAPNATHLSYEIQANYASYAHR